MKLEATITVKENAREIAALFEPEKEHFNQKRSTVAFKENKGVLEVAIKANDSVALRAALTGITKLLTVYEQANKVGNNDRRTRKD